MLTLIKAVAGPSSSTSASAAVATAAALADAEVDGDNADDEDEPIPDLTPVLEDFTKIRVGDFEKSFQFIQAHSREIMRPGAYDELMIAGFRAAIKKDFNYAKQCVHQGLIVQYCEKLGRDGVGLFFQRYVSRTRMSTIPRV